MISYSKKHQQYGYILEAPRTCVAWTYTEKQELIKQIINGLRLEDIAKQNQRTILAVKYFIITSIFCIWNLFFHNGTMTLITAGLRSWRIAPKNIQL